MTPPLLVRADAGPDIGLGHLLRTLALAQAWRRRGGEVTYACAGLPDVLRRRLEREGVRVVALPARHPDPRDAEGLAPLLASPWGWVVVDGYHLDAAYRRRIRETGKRVLIIGDTAAAAARDADAVLNQNAGAESVFPDAEPGAILLLGSRYALVRDEFRTTAGVERPLADAGTRVLLTLGGGDDRGAVAKALRAFALVRMPLAVRVLAGPAHPDPAGLTRLAADASFPCAVVSGEVDLPSLFAWADVAVTASGSTCWELCALGVPMVAVRTADNQLLVERGLAAAGAAVVLGPFDAVEEETLAAEVGSLLGDVAARERLSRAARTLVDGRGAERVVAALLAA